MQTLSLNSSSTTYTHHSSCLHRKPGWEVNGYLPQAPTRIQARARGVSCLSLVAGRPYMRTLHWKSSVIQLATVTQILIFTENVLALPVGGNYFWTNVCYNYFVQVIQILWKRPQQHVRSCFTVSHNQSSKHRFQTDSVKIIYEYKCGSNMDVKKHINGVCVCVWFQI